MNNQCIKCGGSLHDSSDNKIAGICHSCMQKNRCIKCDQPLGHRSDDDKTNSICGYCKRNRK